jgi:uncharacterized protein
MRDPGFKPRVAVTIRARAPLKPTEDPERVRAALLALFPTAKVREERGEMLAEGATLDRLRELIRNERIPDTARGVMLHGLSADGAYARFRVGKQAAAAGRVHFGVLRGPLGDVEVEIEGSEPGDAERAIYRCAPDTTVAPELAEVPPGERPAA